MKNNTLLISADRIYTGLAQTPWVQAVGIRDGRIAAIGTEQEVRRAMPPGDILALPGRMACPGLVDSHCHFNSYGQSLMRVSLAGLPDLTACRERIREAAGNLRPGEWLIGRGWNQYQWADPKEPDKNDLDDLVPHNPAMMIRACGHSEWLNSRALETVGITAESPDPPGGRFERDAAGEPTGLLREARDLVMESVPPPDAQTLKNAALAAQADALKKGLSGVHTCETLEEYQVLAELEAEGRLKMRVHHNLPPHHLDEAAALGLQPGQGSEHLWIGHLKLFADGSLGSGTALIHEPYCDETDNCGLPFLDDDELTTQVLRGYQRGYSVAIHAIGDRAGSNALLAIARGRRRYPGPWRDRVEHVQLFHPPDLDRYKDLNVTASVQPVFVGTDWQVAERRWGAERRPFAYAWKTIMDRGIRMIFGSDAPVEPIAPILGIQTAVLRQDRQQQPENGWRPEEKLSLKEALSGFFANAAWSSGREDRLGSLAPGYLADLTVFAENLDRIPARQWHKVPMEMTIIDGEVAYSR